MPNLQSYLTMGSLEIFKELQIDMGYDMEFRLSGTLSGIHTEDQYNYLEDQLQMQRARGYDGEILSPKEASAIEPEINLDLAGYTYAPGRGQADPVKSTRAFADAAEKAGALIHTGKNVTSIAVSGGGGYSVHTDDTEYRCQTLVLATGSWCGPVGRMLDLDIPIKPIRGQMWATESFAATILSPHFFFRVELRLE